MRQLRILMVAKSTGGVGVYVRNLITDLDKSLFDITVVFLSEGKNEIVQELSSIPGVKTVFFPMNRYKIDFLTDGKVIFMLARMLRHENFDLIHVHASKPGILTRLAAIGVTIPIIYSPHCFSFHPGTGRIKRQILALIERISGHYKTTRFMVVAESEIKLAQKYRVGKLQQFITVNTGIDPSPYQTPVNQFEQKMKLGLESDKFTVGCIGRISEQKSPLDFVNAAAMIAKNHSNVQFLWIGEGPQINQVQEISRKSKISSIIHFVGYRADIPACLAIMDCFVLVSKWEGFPLVILEAMAAGKPIVATDIDGTRDAIHDKVEGLLVPVGCIQEISDAVQAVLTNPILAQSLGSAGRQKVLDQYTQTKMVNKITSLYQETVLRGVG